MAKKTDDSKKTKGSSKASSTKAKKATTIKVNDTLLKQHDDIINMLSIVFLNQKTINLLKTNNDFRQIIINLISIGQQLEKLYKIKSEVNINNSIAAYENITGTKFVSASVNIKANQDADNILEITDDINYLKVFLLNSINLSWDELVRSETKQLDVETNNSTITSNDLNQQTEPTETVDAQKIQPGNTPYRDAEDFLNKNNISLNEIADGIARQQAQLLLQKDIMTNKFYQYDSKPKFFIFSKYTMYVLWSIFYVLFLVDSIFQLILAGRPYALQYFNGDIITQQAQLNNVIAYGGTSYFSIVLFVIMIIFFAFYVFQQVKNHKNDNVRYTFKSFQSWIIILFALFAILIPLMVNPNYSILGTFSQIKNNINIQPQVVSVNGSYNLIFDNQSNYPYYFAYYILTILVIVVIGLILIGTIALMIIRPKPDNERINKKINEYYNDIISGKIRVDDDNAFGGMFTNGKSPFSPF